jgi:hypothetical protein
MLGQAVVGIAAIAKEVEVSQQAIYRIKDDPAGVGGMRRNAGVPHRRHAHFDCLLAGTPGIAHCSFYSPRALREG